MTQSLGKPGAIPEAIGFSAIVASGLRLLYSQERSA
jgi:hypothetical protein